MKEKANLKLTETMKMLSGKNRSKAPCNKVIFKSENGKENIENMSIYRFSMGRMQAV